MADAQQKMTWEQLNANVDKFEQKIHQLPAGKQFAASVGMAPLKFIQKLEPYLTFTAQTFSLDPADEKKVVNTLKETSQGLLHGLKTAATQSLERMKAVEFSKEYVDKEYTEAKDHAVKTYDNNKKSLAGFVENADVYALNTAIIGMAADNFGPGKFKYFNKRNDGIHFGGTGERFADKTKSFDEKLEEDIEALKSQNPQAKNAVDHRTAAAQKRQAEWSDKLKDYKQNRDALLADGRYSGQPLQHQRPLGDAQDILEEAKLEVDASEKFGLIQHKKMTKETYLRNLPDGEALLPAVKQDVIELQTRIKAAKLVKDGDETHVFLHNMGALPQQVMNKKGDELRKWTNAQEGILHSKIKWAAEKELGIKADGKALPLPGRYENSAVFEKAKAFYSEMADGMALAKYGKPGDKIKRFTLSPELPAKDGVPSILVIQSPDGKSKLLLAKNEFSKPEFKPMSAETALDTLSAELEKSKKIDAMNAGLPNYSAKAPVLENLQNEMKAVLAPQQVSEQVIRAQEL